MTNNTIDFSSFQTLDLAVLDSVAGGLSWTHAIDNGNRFGQAGAIIGGAIGLLGGPVGAGVGGVIGGAVGFTAGTSYDLGYQTGQAQRR
jgi:Bacteriocin class II with double-glycine leader peptide